MTPAVFPFDSDAARRDVLFEEPDGVLELLRPGSDEVTDEDAGSELG